MEFILSKIISEMSMMIYYYYIIFKSLWSVIHLYIINKSTFNGIYFVIGYNYSHINVKICKIIYDFYVLWMYNTLCDILSRVYLLFCFNLYNIEPVLRFDWMIIANNNCID